MSNFNSRTIVLSEPFSTVIWASRRISNIIARVLRDVKRSLINFSYARVCYNLFMSDVKVIDAEYRVVDSSKKPDGVIKVGGSVGSEEKKSRPSLRERVAGLLGKRTPAEKFVASGQKIDNQSREFDRLDQRTQKKATQAQAQTMDVLKEFNASLTNPDEEAKLDRQLADLKSSRNKP